MISTPLEVHERTDPTQDARHYVRLVDEHEVDRIVLGLPIHTSGRESTSAVRVRQFGEWIGQATGLPVYYFDERYTSTEAEEHLIAMGMKRKKRKGYRDMLAAQILLQNYLDAGCPETTSPSTPLADAPLEEEG